MQGCLARGPIKGTPHRFAVDGNPLQTKAVTQCIDPMLEALMKGAGVQQAEDAAKGIVGGNAVGQRQKGLEPGSFGAAVLGDVLPAVRTADDGTDGDDDDVHEVVE